MHLLLLFLSYRALYSRTLKNNRPRCEIFFFVVNNIMSSTKLASERQCLVGNRDDVKMMWLISAML